MGPCVEKPQCLTGSGAPLIDIHGVAEVLGVTPRHIQRLVAERRIPYFKVGRFVRFDPGELNEWLNEQRVEIRPSSRCQTPLR
jgi:excisionase family DNA binding protein